MTQDANEIAMDNRFEAVVSASLINHSRRLFRNRFTKAISDSPSTLFADQLARKQKQEIWIETDVDDPLFLKELDEKLQQSVKTLSKKILVLSTEQINYLSHRLHAVLQPKRNLETQLIETWTIQSQSYLEGSDLNRRTQPLQRHHSGHITILKLSTILREVKCLQVHQQRSEMIEAADLEIFPSLETIEIRKMDGKVLSHLYYFAQTLRTLCVEQTQVKCLKEVLSNEDGTRDWKTLDALTIRSCDELSVVDGSVNSLKAIKKIDFGWNRITSITCSFDCSTLTYLCLCHNQLSSLPAMSMLTQLETLNLSMNHLRTLEGVQSLKSLNYLDVSWNRLGDMREVEILRPLCNLKSINLKENPLTRRPDYRREVLFYLGDRVELDSKHWSFAEMDSMAKCRKLEYFAWGDKVIGAESDSAAVKNSPESPGEFQIALEYPNLEDVSSTMHSVDIELAEICNPDLSYHTHTMFHPRFNQEQRPLCSVDEYFRQDTTTRRKLDQADDEEITLQNDSHIAKEPLIFSNNAANATSNTIVSRRMLSPHEAQMDERKASTSVQCSLRLQPGTIIEIFQIQRPTTLDPHRVCYDLAKLTCVGLSTQMNEKLIATRYSDSTVDVLNVMHGFDSVKDLELVLRHIVTSARFLKVQYSTNTMCIVCGAVSIMSEEHVMQSRYRVFCKNITPDSGNNMVDYHQCDDNLPLHVVYCLFCGSGDVRLVSLEHLQKHLKMNIIDTSQTSPDIGSDSTSALHVESNRYDSEAIVQQPMRKCVAKLSASFGFQEKLQVTQR
uniref:Dynein axonemal light chain 1 n=1 Tax=Albugo laibachii Nc14 TaxID=890382 RepID=F0W2F9_9STRA|nr:conserved hypothetical protein [Albugo laibachii Nc14]|eukprot:CCA15245.1 conserved hypothetical protein [Albugo laibachii Nc14]